MSSKQEDTLQQVTIEIGTTNDSDHGNKYKKFDTEAREKVFFFIKLIMFTVAAITCVASFTVPLLQKARPRGIAMWQWSLLITVLLGGPLVSRAIVRFVRHFLGDRDFSAKENVIYYVVGLIESAWVGLWFTMVLIAWLIVVEEPSYLGMPYDEGEKIIRKFNSTYPIVKVTLITMIMGSFLWLLKDLGLMKAKSSFHIRRFFDRIRVALMYQCVIDTLMSHVQSKTLSIDESSFHQRSIDVDRKAKCIVESPCLDQVMTKEKVATCWGLNKSGKIGNEEKSFFNITRIGNKKESIVNISCLNDVTQETVSCWGMKKVIDGMMEIQNHHLCYNDIGFDGSKSRKKIQTEEEAIAVAETIFKSLFYDQSTNRHIGDERLDQFFPDEEVRRRAKECLHEGAGAKVINEDVFKKWMVKAHRERLSLVRALVANKNLFKALNRFINVLLVFLIFALWLIMIKVQTRKIIFVTATAIAGSAFIFGETCKKILENLLFVFLVHPYDVGDCCLIDDTPVIIEEISVLSTTALTLENEIKHYSNSTLAAQTISNYTRSKHMGDWIEFPLNSTTPRKRIKELKEKVERYIQDEAQHWYSDHQWVMEFGETNQMKMRLHFLHSINYHDYREIQSRKSELVSKINEILIELKLTITNEEEKEHVTEEIESV